MFVDKLLLLALLISILLIVPRFRKCSLFLWVFIILESSMIFNILLFLLEFTGINSFINSLLDCTQRLLLLLILLFKYVIIILLTFLFLRKPSHLLFIVKFIYSVYYLVFVVILLLLLIKCVCINIYIVFITRLGLFCITYYLLIIMCIIFYDYVISKVKLLPPSLTE